LRTPGGSYGFETYVRSRVIRLNNSSVEEKEERSPFKLKPIEGGREEGRRRKVASSPEDDFVDSLPHLLGKLRKSSLPSDPSEVRGLDILETGRVEEGGRREDVTRRL